MTPVVHCPDATKLLSVYSFRLSSGQDCECVRRPGVCLRQAPAVGRRRGHCGQVTGRLRRGQVSVATAVDRRGSNVAGEEEQERQSGPGRRKGAQERGPVCDQSQCDQVTWDDGGDQVTVVGVAEYSGAAGERTCVTSFIHQGFIAPDRRDLEMDS